MKLRYILLLSILFGTVCRGVTSLSYYGNILNITSQIQANTSQDNSDFYNNVTILSQNIIKNEQNLLESTSIATTDITFKEVESNDLLNATNLLNTVLYEKNSRCRRNVYR